MKKRKKTIFRKIFKRIIKSDIAQSFICRIIYVYVKLVARTTKWNNCGDKDFLETLEGEGAILCSWHSRIAMLATFGSKGKKVNALVSMHRDGRYIANLLERFKFNIISGSTTKNAKAAALQMMRCLENDEIIAIIPDGPVGPAQKMSMSPIFYAHKTGKPIIASAYSIKNSKTIEKSWDKMMLPLPFSKGAFVFSEPFYVPKDAKKEELEEYRKKFEKELNKVTKKADKIVGRI